jgi:hypothetical protein
MVEQLGGIDILIDVHHRDDIAIDGGMTRTI